MDTKSLFASKTVWGVVVAAVAMGAQHFAGLSISDADQAQLVDIALKGVEVLGLGIAIVGRIVASKRIG